MHTRIQPLVQQGAAERLTPHCIAQPKAGLRPSRAELSVKSSWARTLVSVAGGTHNGCECACTRAGSVFVVVVTVGDGGETLRTVCAAVEVAGIARVAQHRTRYPVVPFLAVERSALCEGATKLGVGLTRARVECGVGCWLFGGLGCRRSSCRRPRRARDLDVPAAVTEANTFFITPTVARERERAADSGARRRRCACATVADIVGRANVFVRDSMRHRFSSLGAVHCPFKREQCSMREWLCSMCTLHRHALRRHFRDRGQSSVGCSNSRRCHTRVAQQQILVDLSRSRRGWKLLS
jgi:hypothetical protein